MNRKVKMNCFKKAAAWITCCVCLVMLSGCLTGKLIIRDKKTGMTVTIQDDQIETYVKTVDCGRFAVTSEEEAELAEDTILK